MKSLPFQKSPPSNTSRKRAAGALWSVLAVLCFACFDKVEAAPATSAADAGTSGDAAASGDAATLGDASGAALPAETPGTTAFGAALSDWVDRCAGFGDLPGSYFADEARLQFGARQNLPDTEAALLACAAALSNSACGTVIEDVPACAALVHAGSAPGGAKCRQDRECASGQCGEEDGQCATCAPALPEGADCSSGSVNCTFPLTCRPDANGAKICQQPLKSPGADCAANSECSGVCTNGKCAVKPPRKLGEACDSGFATPDEACVEGTLCSNGSCRIRPPAGFPCDGYCAVGLVCDKLCRAPKAPQANGSVCVASRECTSGLCFENACKELPKAGEPCAGDRCVFGAACDFSGNGTPMCKAIDFVCK